MLARRTVLLLIAAVLPVGVWLATSASGEPPASEKPLSGLDGQGTPKEPLPLKVSLTERAAAAGLNWLARHQSADGNWSFQDFSRLCKDQTCSGPGETKADTAATAVALLTFLGAKQSHKSKGPYRKNVYAGLYWLIKNQKTSGCLAEGMDTDLAGHSLATIALAETYRLTNDPTVGGPAQQAINFIQGAPLPDSEFWQYRPGRSGDSSVVVWQLLALGSGRLSGLDVNDQKLAARARWVFDRARDARRHDVAASAAGLLAAQALRIEPDHPDVILFVRRLLAAEPTGPGSRDCVAWLFATKGLRACGGEDWITWTIKLSSVRLEEQIQQDCAQGSWSPSEPVEDAWGSAGGRLLVTAMSILPLEIYYQYASELNQAAAGDGKTPGR